MTEDELNDIEARANAATPGVWISGKYPGEKHMVRQETWVGCVDPTHDDCAIAQAVALVRLGHDDAIVNAAFIAHARADIPALIAEIRRLRALL